MSSTTVGAGESNTPLDVALNAHHIMWGSTGTNQKRKHNGICGKFEPEYS